MMGIMVAAMILMGSNNAKMAVIKRA